MLTTALIDSSTFLTGQLNAVLTDLKWCEQNAKHSSTIYLFAMEPFG